jgi:hypothetical protein
MLDYSLEHIFSYTAALSIEVIGPLPEGVRVNYYVTRGTVTGPKLKGKMLPVGGDWNILRTDGVGILDVRATFETDDGTLILTTYSGVYDLGKDGYEKFLRQELPAVIPIRMAPRFHTAHPGYEWLNRLQGLGIGQIDTARSEVRYEVYAVR